MQHQQNRDDFADAQAGRRPARRGAVPNQMGFPLRQKGFAKIVHRAKGFDQPLQHVDLSWHDWFGSILRIIDSQCVNASDTRYRGYSNTVATAFVAPFPDVRNLGLGKHRCPMEWQSSLSAQS